MWLSAISMCISTGSLIHLPKVILLPGSDVGGSCFYEHSLENGLVACLYVQESQQCPGWSSCYHDYSSSLIVDVTSPSIIAWSPAKQKLSKTAIGCDLVASQQPKIYRKAQRNCTELEAAQSSWPWLRRVTWTATTISWPRSRARLWWRGLHVNLIRAPVNGPCTADTIPAVVERLCILWSKMLASSSWEVVEWQPMRWRCFLVSIYLSDVKAVKEVDFILQPFNSLFLFYTYIHRFRCKKIVILSDQLSVIIIVWPDPSSVNGYFNLESLSITSITITTYFSLTKFHHSPFMSSWPTDSD